MRLRLRAERAPAAIAGRRGQGARGCRLQEGLGRRGARARSARGSGRGTHRVAAAGAACHWARCWGASTMASAEKKKRRRWDSAVPAEEQEGQAPPQAEQDETQAKKPKLDDHTSADAPPVNGSQSQPAPQKKPSATLAALQKAKKALQMKKEALSKLKGKPDAGGAQSAAGTTAATAPAKPRASRFGPKVRSPFARHLKRREPPSSCTR
eukprot:scaffold2089_cov336-Prasinococcus_capsulatus_cf.AAC.5